MTNQIDLVCPATELGVREVIGKLMGKLADFGLTRDACGNVEIALSEALNNVVEHAYAGIDCGRIVLSCQRIDGALVFEIVDTGAPLPDLALPEGAQVDVSGPVEHLPEGGFGWFLIRTLSDDLRYFRDDGQNRLNISFAFHSEVPVTGEAIALKEP
ncbi:ATP-binding protein [Thalassococcus sp. S3]|uniref:ATP-binding protein n=1 Tax=Thalassococcus sp. S3 TaxID=2017482 RepID=UPI0010247841|nr:ATP-binding protein [Thalassococcus sp. S3]QBF33774.1 ATPase [Thalassococcus sp. S3]